MSADEESRMSEDVIENAALHRFELPIEGGDGAIAAAYYRMDGDVLVLTHTDVPSQFGGRGIGSSLARGVFENLRATGRKAVLRCPFMAAWYAKHLDFGDVVAG